MLVKWESAVKVPAAIATKPVFFSGDLAIHLML